MLSDLAETKNRENFAEKKFYEDFHRLRRINQKMMEWKNIFLAPNFLFMTRKLKAIFIWKNDGSPKLKTDHSLVEGDEGCVYPNGKLFC